MIVRRPTVWCAAVVVAAPFVWALCTHPRGLSANEAERWQWLVPAAAAAEKAGEGPRVSVRVGCGTLSDSHGAQVVGKGTSEGAVNPDPQRCPSSTSTVTAAPAATAVPVQTPEPAHRPPQAPAAFHSPDPDPVQVDPEWLSDHADRSSRLAPSHAERLSTAILSSSVLWFLQSSFWTSLLLLGLPLWRHVDLLAIVARAPHDETDDGPAGPNLPEEESISRVLDKRIPHSDEVVRP